MTDKKTPDPIEGEFEDDPQLRRLFKGYVRDALNEWFAEHEESDDGNTGDGTGGTEAGKARAETSESKATKLRSIFAK